MENTRVDVSTGVGGGLAQSLHQPSLDSLKKSGIEECFLNEVIDNHPDTAGYRAKTRANASLSVFFFFFFHAKTIRKFSISMRINRNIRFVGYSFRNTFEIYLL